MTGTNLLASLEPGEPNHAGVTGGKSLWYQWTATATGAITIDTLGSNFDTELAVYTGTAINALTIVAQNADVGGSPPYNVLSSVTFNPVVGTTYWIAVDGYRGRSGGLSLNWNQAVLGGAARGSLAQNQRDLTLETTSRHLDLTCSPVEDGGFLLAIHGDPKTDYELESSSDLILWSRVHTVQTDDHGLSLIVDRSKPVGRVSISDPLCGAESGLNPAALRASTPQLFYRARPTDSTATDELIQ